MAFFNITSDAEFSGATVTFPDGSVQVIGSDNKNYQTVINGLLDGSLSDDQLLDLIAPFEAIYKTLTKLSERVARKGSKLLFDGDVVNNALTKYIIEIMNEGGDEDAWKAYVKFMEKLYTNPSKQSQDHLFAFIDRYGLLVTPDGDLVAYKSTKLDGTSTYSGYGIVNGVEYQNAYLQNEVGTVVEIPRSMVDDNRNVGCSVGLHVGAFSYAKGYSQRLWTVIVNPRDVVSVPHENKDAKIRVARYQIVEENKDRIEYKGTVKSFEGTEAPAEPTVTAVVGEPKTVEADEPAKVVQAVVQTPATTTAGAGSRVSEYENLIRSGGAGSNLRKFRNKKVTPGRRSDFDRAVKNLGLQY